MARRLNVNKMDKRKSGKRKPSRFGRLRRGPIEEFLAGSLRTTQPRTGHRTLLAQVPELAPPRRMPAAPLLTRKFPQADIAFSARFGVVGAAGGCGGRGALMSWILFWEK